MFVFWIGWCLCLFGAVGWIAGRLHVHQFAGFCALKAGLSGIEDMRAHDSASAAVEAAICAACAYIWWRGGGGDDTKRRLRHLRAKFTPVRRTAPAIA